MMYDLALGEEESTSQTTINVAYVMLNCCVGEPKEDISSCIARLSSRVRPIRAERAKYLRRPIDRLSSLVAGALIDRAIAAFTHQQFLPIIEEPYGKPDFPKGSGLHFNLSHSSAAVCCAVSCRPVGIDVEGHIESYEDICAMCLTDVENLRVKNCLNRDERIRTFMRLWTRKEALGKYLGCGVDESVLLTDLLHWPANAKKLLEFWQTEGTHETPPQIETFDLHKACMSVYGHGKVRVSSYTLNEVLEFAPVAPAVHSEKEGDSNE